MKTAGQLKSMLFNKLAELQDGGIKKNNPIMAEQLKIELSLLYDILEEDIDEEYWEQIEMQISE